MPQTNQRRNLTVRSYQVRTKTWNEDDRSVEAVIATEEPAIVLDMRTWEPILEVLRMGGAVIPASRQVPLLDTHDRTTIEKVLGSTRELEVVEEDGKKVLKARNFISSAEPSAATKVREGDVTDNSVGYVPLASVDIEPGQTVEVEGKSYTAPLNRTLRVTTSWQVKENSLTPIGADAGAKNREEQEDIQMAKPTGDTPPADTGTPTPESTPAAPDEATVRNALLQERKAEIMAITPAGFEDISARSIIDGLSVVDAQKALSEEFANRAKPVGTPESPEPDAPKDEKVEAAKAVDDMSDEDFARACGATVTKRAAE